MQKNVVAVATANTYEMVIKYGIHAHPAVAPYPKPREYLIPIKAGGQCEYIYSVIKAIDIIPNDIKSVSAELKDEERRALFGYCDERVNSYGFSRIGIPYRFYILKKIGCIEQPFYKKGIQNCVLMEFDEIPILRG